MVAVAAAERAEYDRNRYFYLVVPSENTYLFNILNAHLTPNNIDINICLDSCDT